jgi:hypothetical protein
MSPSTPAAPTRMLSVAQAPERLSTIASALYELVASQVIASVRIGRTIGIPEAALHRLENEPAEHLAQPGRATDRRSISTAQQHLTSAAVLMPDRRHREQQASDRRATRVRRTPVRPDIPTQTCTPVRPVDASTRRAQGRHGHEPA